MARAPLTREEYQKLFPAFVEKYPDGNYGPSEAPGVPIQTSNPTRSGTGTSPGNGSPSSSTTGPSAPAPKNYSAGIDLKSRLLQPALTTHYQVWIDPSSIPFADMGRKTLSKFMGYLDSRLPGSSELLLISCSEASLPGSSLTTQELNDDYTGITQRHAYRRLYDDRIDFTFYVNQTYDQIRFFERWMQWISGEQISTNEENHFVRFRFPQTYKTTIFIDKFERNAQIRTGKNVETNGPHTGEKLTYEFINAFPISINSMPVSYDSSQLLKCTVAFSYDRYLMKNISTISTETEPSQPTATGVPTPTPEDQKILDLMSGKNVPTNEELIKLGYSVSNAPEPTIRRTQALTQEQIRNRRLGL
jgi:hypothetical protein